MAQKNPAQTFKSYSTSAAQLPAPYRDSSHSTTGASLEDDHPRTHIRTRLQKRKERRNNAEGKAKRQCTSMELDTKVKQHSARLLTKEITAKESPEDTNTDDTQFL